MDARARTITEVELLAARKQAERELASQDFSRVDEEVQASLLDITSGYLAATRTGMPPSQSLEASLGVFWKRESAPQEIVSLEGLLGAVARTPQSAPEVLGGALSHLVSTGPSFRVRLGDSWYVRKLSDKPEIIGLDDQLRDISTSVNHLFAYRPQEGINPLRDQLHPGILLYGPPGTGKSSLCRYAIAQAKDWAAARGIAFRHELFRPSDYSKWVGESAQALRRKFLSVSDSSGVGILVLDDVDMVLASRDDASASHGGLQVTSEAMQFMSGVEQSFQGNYLVLGTTNRTDLIDGAMSRRFTHRILLPGYTSQQEFSIFVDQRLSWADDATRSLVADTGFENLYSPAQMDMVCRHLSRSRFGILSSEQLKNPLVHAQEIGVRQARKILNDYCVSNNERK